MYPPELPLAEPLRQGHAQSLARIARPGPFWTGAERIAMVEVARAATDCRTCSTRRAALTPGAVSSPHDGPQPFPAGVVDAIHRIRTDPGRLTRAWFEQLTEELPVHAYLELVSVVTSSVIIDTLHLSLGLAPPALPDPVPGPATRGPAGDTVDDGAWVPLTRAPRTLADTGLPVVPNIVRALGHVPDAVELFFGTFRPHYALRDAPLSLSQAQAELVAARTSALNQCFY